MNQWDMDRYEQLQDSAWRLELLASEQRSITDPQTRAASRTRAGELRQQAADMLAGYWAPRRSINKR